MLAHTKCVLARPPERPSCGGSPSNEVKWAEVNYDGVRFLIGSFGRRTSAAAGVDPRTGSVTECQEVTHVG